MVNGWINRRIIGRLGVAGGIFAALLIGGCAGQRPIEDMRSHGDALYQRGEYAAAATEYRQIVDRYPGDWRAEYRLGLSELEVGNAGAARQALEIANTRRPGDVPIADALAEALFQMGDADELFRFLRDRAKDRHNTHAYLRLAQYSIRLEDPDSAQHALDTAMTLDGGNTVETYLVAADLAEWLGDRDEAVRRLRQAYGLDPGNKTVNTRLRAHGEVPGPTIALAPGP